MVLAAFFLISPAAGAEAQAPPASLKNPEQWRFLEPHGVIIFTSDDQVRAVAEDPARPVKGLEFQAPGASVSFVEYVRNAALRGETHVTVSFDFFFGGSARELHPTHPDFVRAVQVMAKTAADAGLGIGASVLNPLDMGRDFKAQHGSGGEQHGFAEGALDAEGRFELDAPVERVWCNNKGPIFLRLRGVRAFAFREDPIAGTPYLAVRPGSIVEAKEVRFEELPDRAPRPGGYHRGMLRVRGRTENPGGRNRVLVIVVHETPEMDYFHPQAPAYVKGIVDLYDRRGVRFREFYSDEMHIQFDWDLGAHIGLREIRTRYLTPSFARELAALLPAELSDPDRMLVYHGFHEEGGRWSDRQHVLGPDPLDIERTFWMRKRYFELLQERVVGLCLEGLRHAERLYGFLPSTRAHATWQESPTCDMFCPEGIFQAATARGISTCDYSPRYVSSSAIREAISACYDYFAWNDFFTAGGNDFLECGLLDRDYYGGAMAASFAALNRYSTSYWGCWGFPDAVGARVGPVLEAYGSGAAPHAWVQGLTFRDARVGILFPLDPLYRDERFGSWTVQYGYANYLSEEKLAGRGRVAGSLLEVGRGRYRILYIPFLSFPRKETLALLETFARAGGTVVWGSAPPVLGRDGKPVGEEWSRLFGVRPKVPPHLGKAAGEVRFSGILSAVRPMKVPTELPVDLVHPIEPAAGSEVAARAGGEAVGASRRLGQGRLAYLGFRLRDDQSRSSGEDVATLTEVLEALGGFGAADACEPVSRRGPYLVNRFANGSYSLAPHYREIAERWDGGFFRDAQRDAKALEGRALPPLEYEVKDLAFDGHRLSYKGSGCVSFRQGPGGIAAFAGAGATGLTLDGKTFAFTRAPARIGFAPVAAERLPEGVERGVHLLLDASEAVLPLGLKDPGKARAFRDAFGDGRKLEPVKIEMEPAAEGVLVKMPEGLRGAQIVILEP